MGLALLLLTLPVRGAELPPEVERALPREAGQLLKDVDHWDVNSFPEGLCAIWNHLRKDVNTVLRRQTRGAVSVLLVAVLLAALFVLVVIGGTLGVQGWRLYRATAAQKPIAGLYDEISSRPGFASCDQLPQTYIDAVISVEDSRFERHHGIDPAAIVRALWADLRTRSLAEGGSTLTQQLAKNELFTQEKQMARKAAEMFAARDIEDYYSKQQIFEMYAGSCYFGNQWSGVAQAAQGYFGKPTQELTRAECVVLAGLPNAPSVYAANGELARRRALVVVERMERAKKLTHTQALELRDEVSALPLW